MTTTVTINQALAQADPTNDPTVNYDVVFSEPVTGFDIGDVSFTGSAAGFGAGVLGSGANYTLTVFVSTQGTVVASIPAGAALDGALQPTAASTSTDNTVTFDAVAPNVTINQAPGQPDPTTGSAIVYDVVFSEPVTGFDGSDISFAGSTAVGPLLAGFTGSGANYTVTVTGMTSNGTVVASIPAGVATDAADNSGAASTSTDNTVTFLSNPGINIVKFVNGQDADSPSGPHVAFGSTVTFTYVVTNTGNVPLANVVVSDDKLGPITSFTGDTIGNGLLDLTETWTYTTTATAQAGQQTNTGTVTGQDANNPLATTTDDNPANYFGDAPGIHIVKFVNGLDADSPTGPHVAVGSTVTFTYVVTNTGNVPLVSVPVTDDNGTPGNPADDFNATFSGGDTNTNGLLDLTETWTYTQTATAQLGQQTNVATVTAHDANNPPGTMVTDDNPANYFGDGTPAINIVKFVNGQDADSPSGPHVAFGSTVTFTYVVTNTGNVPLANVVVSDDKLGPITSFTGDTIGNGLLDLTETWTYTTTATAQAGQQTNTGTVTGQDANNPLATTTDDNPANYFGDAPGIHIVKFVNGLDADSPTGPHVAVGSTVTFTYVVTNTGNVPLVSVPVTDDNGTPGNPADDFNATFSGGDTNTNGLLDLTETWTYTQTATAQLGQQTNVATVTAHDANNPPGTMVTDDNPANYFGGINVDLSVTKTVSDATPNVGDQITFTVTLSNLSSDDATGVEVIDQLPAGLTFVSSTISQGVFVVGSGVWLVGTVSPGAPETLTITASVDSPDARTNTGTITDADQPDPDPTNNTASATETPQQIDLSVTKTVSDATPNVGDQITFTVTLSNLSSDDATGVEVIDQLPAGLTFVSSTISQGVFIVGSGVWLVGTVSPGAPETLTITASVDSPDAQTNTGTITDADQPDPDPTNNTASATETPQQIDLSVTKTVSDATPNVGDQITFTVTLSNLSSDDATGVEVIDQLPAGLTFVSSTISQGVFIVGSGVWLVGTVSPGAPETLTITASVDSPDAQTNTGTITDADQPDPDPTNNTASATVIPCYCDGTLILTDRGELPVEALAVGDKVMTAQGAARPIRWIGRRSYSGRFARGNHVLPICIKAGALDEDRPCRDLWISPNHAMFLHGALIEARDLVNGVSIVQAASVERVDYFHIELETHDIIVAEGALSESFVDDDSRGLFQNAHEFRALYPDERARPDPYCAPRLAFGAQVEAVRRQIAQRAGISYVPPAAAPRPRALVIDSRYPEIGHDGGANAILDHMRALQAAGFQVSFLALGHDGRKNTQALSSLGVTPLSLPSNGSVGEVLRAHAGQFDLVYLHRVESAVHCLKLARQYFDAQIVYSVADLHHVRLKAQSELDHDHASELMQQAQCFAIHELVAALSADCVITHSVVEADQLQQIPSLKAENKTRVVTWTVPVAPVRRPFADRSGLAFIGGFAHAPNVDAAQWLVNDVMPLVWQEAPEITCLLIGSDMSEDLRQQLQRPGVEVLGRVDRLADVFERIRLTVAPLRFGAGLKDKVLRGMGAGLPCVGTTEAFKGMQELPSTITSDCRRETAADLAAAIVRMHRDEAANTSCAQTGLMYVGAFYNQERIDALIQEMAQPALARYRAKSRSRSECIVLNFGDTPRQPSATVATRAQPTAKRVAFR